jgi:hypothetical protein
MDPERLASLRQAATALISTAAASTVLAALQTLLTDPAFTTEKPPRPSPSPPAPTPHRAPSPAPRVASPARPAAAAPPVVDDADWLELRSQVKKAMAERGADYAGVAQAIGRSAIAVRITLGSRKAPKPSVQRRLQTWLAAKPAGAPAVAAPLAFSGRGNGHDAAGAYSSSAAD